MKTINQSLFSLCMLLFLISCQSGDKTQSVQEEAESALNNSGTSSTGKMAHYTKHIKSLRPKSTKVIINRSIVTIDYDVADVEDPVSKKMQTLNFIIPRINIGQPLFFLTQDITINNTPYKEAVFCSNVDLGINQCSTMVKSVSKLKDTITSNNLPITYVEINIDYKKNDTTANTTVIYRPYIRFTNGKDSVMYDGHPIKFPLDQSGSNTMDFFGWISSDLNPNTTNPAPNPCTLP